MIQEKTKIYNSSKTKKESLISERLIIKYQYHTNFYFLTLIIFIILGIFTDIDKNKRITRTSLLTRARSFMQNCTEGILLNPNINVSNVNTSIKISVVIPVYNCEKTLKAAVRSIQNQNMTNIEIILVNDFSKDKSLEIIKELMKEDPRIKLINNEKIWVLYIREILVY
jgi:hypothetical protein